MLTFILNTVKAIRFNPIFDPLPHLVHSGWDFFFLGAAMRTLAFSLFISSVLFVLADGPADNLAEKVRPVPPEGIPVPAEVRTELKKGLEVLGNQITSLKKSLVGKPQADLLPDVEIFYNSVRYALTYNEFYDAREFPVAAKHLQLGLERAKALAEGKAPWTTATGLVVRGYRSNIDDSVQPYGLVIPADYTGPTDRKRRLDLWCHGRSEKLSELSFIEGRLRSPGEFTPAGGIVLHLYGRYCCANKFAGEIDALEAMTHVQRFYPIDRNRVVVRGFSMGGAACWQFAVHYPGRWVAAAPGAGFSETPDFLKVFQKEIITPNAWEKKLLHLYDCTDWAINLANLPVVAYSGEIDNQKQAADIMATSMKKEGLELKHIIGPKTGHSFHPLAKKEVNELIDAVVEKGRNPIPKRIRFTTYTLRYNQLLWVQVDLLKQHWEKGLIDAEIVDAKTIKATTSNIEGLTLNMPKGLCPLDATENPKVILDGTEISCPKPMPDLSWTVHFRKEEGAWKLVTQPTAEGSRKVHGLSGPIDDAFMGSFLVVKPTGESKNPKVQAWVQAEMDRAIAHWRKQFRGDARVKNDTDVTEDDIKKHHLILWGDASSNKLIAKISAKLPVQWDTDLVVNKEKFTSSDHALIMIHPNPENPKKYVVLNSGFTFRDYDYLNNARQIPRLPDYAVIDLNVPPNGKFPGKVKTAGFFNDSWKFE